MTTNGSPTDSNRYANVTRSGRVTIKRDGEVIFRFVMRASTIAAEIEILRIRGWAPQSVPVYPVHSTGAHKPVRGETDHWYALVPQCDYCNTVTPDAILTLDPYEVEYSAKDEILFEQWMCPECYGRRSDDI